MRLNWHQEITLRCSQSVNFYDSLVIWFFSFPFQSDSEFVNLSPGKKVELIKTDNSSSFVPGEIIPPSKQQQPIINVAVQGFRSFDILIKSSGSKYYPLIPKKVTCL